MEEKIGRILEGLNPEQKNAVEAIQGPVLIVAGAGSGKTRVLTSRVAYILGSANVEPEQILALTFTRKAANEMKERIASMVGGKKAHKVVMGTFHSIFVRFLRLYADKLGYPTSFTIYDQSDSISAMRACIKELKLDDKIYKPKEVLSRISLAKNALFTPQNYRSNPQFATADSASRKPKIGELYALYQQKLQSSGVMDFDDILLQTNILFRDHKDALEEIASRFSYIMVDEYQDTNYAQYLILKKLAAKHRNICVVGDDSQSIYAFRGAKIENILNFKKDYPESKIVRLERNYRSTSNIVNAANSLIEHNSDRIPKKCYATGEPGEKITFLKAYTDKEESVMIVGDIIQRMRTYSAQYQDFAILYRTNSQSRSLEEQLRRRNIPYMIYSGNSFFERAEIKDMMAYFKLVVNPSDNESFKRAVNNPTRGIGDTSISALNECARANGCSLFKAAFMPDLPTFGLRSATIAKIVAFCRMIDGFAARVASTDASRLAKEIGDASGLYAMYKEDKSIEGMARVDNLDELFNSVDVHIEDRQEEFADNGVPESEFPVVSLADYLENVALLSSVDVSSGEDTNNKVALMTVHSAKGLEFPFVYVAGCEENLFPSGGFMASPADIEEERRLFYVAITRAKKAVNISFADTRLRNGKHENNPPSRFVTEIDPAFIENPLSEQESMRGFGAAGFGSGGRSNFGSAGHSNFGSGFGGRASSGGFGSSGRASSGCFGSGGRASSGSFGSSGRASSAGHYSGYNSYASSGPAVSYGTRSAQSTPSSAGLQTSIRPTAKPAIIDADFVPVPMTQLFEGERIEHNRFGAGTILSLSGTAPDMKAFVDFDDYGKKQLLLKYAKLRPLGQK